MASSANSWKRWDKMPSKVKNQLDPDPNGTLLRYFGKSSLQSVYDRYSLRVSNRNMIGSYSHQRPILPVQLEVSEMCGTSANVP